VPTRPDVGRLERSLRHAYEHDLPRRDVIALLRALVGYAAQETADWEQLRVELAENLLRDESGRTSAWEAARLAQDALASTRLSQELRARAHAVQGLAQTLLGNLRAARSAYRRALQFDTSDPVVAHNLGHLLVAAFGDPANALPLLRRAYLELKGNSDVAASYAHALVRAGQAELAERVLRSAGVETSRIQSWIRAWT